MILSQPDLIVVDVREYSEFCSAAQHIENIVSLPLNSGVLGARYTELPSTANILVVCSSGGRSDVAATFLESQGFTNVYDMSGGMNAWTWEREPCDSEPALKVGMDAVQLEVDWTPTSGVQDYDLLRGDGRNLLDAVTFVTLGPVDCLANDSPFTYTDVSGSTVIDLEFYLVRQKSGSWGQSSGGLERVPGSSGCE